MKLASIIFEGFRNDVSIVNGKKYSVDWLGTADTLLDFTRALDRIPDTIESIQVPINTTIFASSKDNKTIKPEGDWRKEVRTIVFKVVGEHEKEGNKLEGIRISSFYTIFNDCSLSFEINIINYYFISNINKLISKIYRFFDLT